jgi:hypothetical protein
VELVGFVEPVVPLEAPLTGEPCVIYQVWLTLMQRLREAGGRGGGSSEVAGSRFWLRIESVPEKPILVDPSQAELRLRRRAKRRVRLGGDLATDGRLHRLYRRLSRLHPPRQVVACKERRLGAGDRVLLLGDLTTPPDPRGHMVCGYREPPRILLFHAARLVALW